MSLSIAAGKFKGRVLKTPPEKITRPTSQKLRAALFNILAAEMEDACFYDLAAGSGAIGFEALSRGASFVFFVENQKDAIAAILANQKLLQVEECSKLIAKDLRHLSPFEKKADIVYLDPPYDLFVDGEEIDILLTLVKNGSLNDRAKIFWEHSKRKSFSKELQKRGEQSGLLHQKSRKYGEIILEEFYFQASCNS